MKNLLYKYKHALMLLYCPFYMLAFNSLERNITTDFVSLNSPIDDLIPFVEIFIIPYLIWFFYIGFNGFFIFLKTQNGFVRLMLMLIIGMSSFIFICFIYPNGLRNFRCPTYSDTIFATLINRLHSIDTPTNVFPSIHVFNSLCMHVALSKYSADKNKWVKPCSFILCVLICLSTMFLKQHSIIDVIAGTVMALIAYKIVYKTPINEWIDKHTW